jgi:hypothetical protein
VWAAIWAAITVPWVRAAMARERKGWEEDSASVIDEEKQPAPPPVAPGPLAGKASESSTLRGSEADRHPYTNGTIQKKDNANNDGGESSSRPSDGTTV